MLDENKDKKEIKKEGNVETTKENIPREMQKAEFKKVIKKGERVELTDEDSEKAEKIFHMEKAKKMICAQMNQLNINSIIVAAITSIAEEVIQRLDTIEVEGERIRIKFK